MCSMARYFVLAFSIAINLCPLSIVFGTETGYKHHPYESEGLEKT